MTPSPTSIRIAVAEAMGYKLVNYSAPHSLYADKHGSLLFEEELPRYDSSRDTCAEFEREVENDATVAYTYAQRLIEVTSAKTGLLMSWKLIRATALQRCEAFLRTVAPGKWEELSKEITP